MGGSGIDKREHLFLSISLKSQIFITPKLGGIGGNEIKFNDFFTKTLKKYSYIFNLLF